MENMDEYLNWYCKKELINLYAVSKKTYNSWMEDIKDKIGKEKGRKYTMRQAEIIFSYCGVPPILILLKKHGRLQDYFRTRIVKPEWLREFQ